MKENIEIRHILIIAFKFLCGEFPNHKNDQNILEQSEIDEMIKTLVFDFL